MNNLRCLSQIKFEPAFMTANYDGLPREVREALQQASFNICAACASDQFSGLGMSESERIHRTVRWIREADSLLKEIEDMRKARF